MSEPLSDRAPAITNLLLGVTRGGNSHGPASDFLRGTIHRSRVDARTQETLRLLASFRALRRVQLEEFLFERAALSATSRRVVAHRLLSGLRERGLVEPVVAPGTVVGGDSRAYVLTAAGRRVYAASDPSYPSRLMRSPSTLALLHALLLAEVALAFRRGASDAPDASVRWEADWEVVARVGRAFVIPDAFATIEQGGWRVRAFVEADRATEHPKAFARKVHRYVGLYLCGGWRREFHAWPLILTVTTSNPHARSLSRIAGDAATRSGAERIARAFRFTSADELRRMGPLAPIWYVPGCEDRSAILELSDEDNGAVVGRPASALSGTNGG